MLDIAKEAIEQHLKLDKYIEANKFVIYKKIEQREEHVTEAQGADHYVMKSDAGNDTFLAESLALMSGVIADGTNKENFQSAKRWVKKRFPKAKDPVPVFFALTLIYVVEKGWEEANSSQNEERKAVWDRICKRIKGFSQSTHYREDEPQNQRAKCHD